MKKSINFLETHPKTVFIVLVGVILLLIIKPFHKKESNPINTNEIAAQVIRKQRDNLLLKNDSLEKIIKNQREQAQRREKDIIQMTQVHQIKNEEIKNLPLDESCDLLQSNFKDSTKVQKIQIKGCTLIGITPEQTTETNLCYSDKRFLNDLVDSLQLQINNGKNIDLKQQEVIENLKSLMKGQEDLHSMEIIGLNGKLKETEKVANRQRTLKRLSMWGAGVAIVVAIMK